jgi:hypothetical protein
MTNQIDEAAAIRDAATMGITDLMAKHRIGYGRALKLQRAAGEQSDAAEAAALPDLRSAFDRDEPTATETGSNEERPDAGAPIEPSGDIRLAAAAAIVKNGQPFTISLNVPEERLEDLVHGLAREEAIAALLRLNPDETGRLLSFILQARLDRMLFGPPEAEMASLGERLLRMRAPGPGLAAQ